MKTKIRPFIIVAVLVNVSACTYIKTLFPDKEKDYQFTTEIPPLTIPPDLAGDAGAKLPTPAPAPAPSSVAETAEAAVAAPSTEEAPSVERKSIHVELVDADQGTKRLRINAPLSMAWRMVGKALSRKSIEVTNRNQEEGLFRVQYDANKQAVEDGSVWDEVNFFFEGLQTTEREYILKLVENNRQTEVVVMDQDQKPVADSTSLNLLTLLHDTIKADLAK
ncbi:outer membrane protein assembly factor BamC [Candidatus Methylobacter oryzae]|uniref:Outer membrane protein assembly factor BamC n=1 Tax=Candidatus Methylobacter oryzae TaxID=2497749 RepID=A0ABY3C4Q1_9GAMM|nr:outer membrane protein assembly factor BamC [Candidatus Methylobacter oryzae]TRW89700.1 outer membrane protein assembly factor BamC [Candidatus Methylobacter oryzae]